MVTEDDGPPAAVAGLPAEGAVPTRRRGGKWRTAATVAGGVIIIALAGIWFARERLADRLIADQLAGLGLPATYRVESIGPRRQVLRDVVVGDPARPDLTVERIETTLSPAGLERVTLVRPRLYGTWRDGALHFGSLDSLLSGKSGEPFRLPQMDLSLVDGRALLRTPYGPVGIKAAGAGPLRHGFKGIVAAVAPQAAGGGCRAQGATAYLALAIDGERPRVRGPVRLAGLACAGPAVRLASAAVRLDATFDRALDGAEGTIGLNTGALGWQGNRAASATGQGRFAWRNGVLSARPELMLAGLDSPHAAVRSLAVQGRLRASSGFSRVELEGEVKGEGIRPGRTLDRGLADAENAAQGTFGAPLLARFRQGLRQEAADSALAASFIVRGTGKALHLVVPQGSLRGASGGTLLSLSRVRYSTMPDGPPEIAGNFSTGGANLPRIAGRMEQSHGGRAVMRLTMADYAAGDARLAIPRLMLVQQRGGALGFAGDVRIGGSLPGGSVRNLALPVDGNWAPRSGLALWRRCLTARFDSLSIADLVIGRRAMNLCPQPGGAIVRTGPAGLRVALGASALDLAGRLGQTPIRISSGPVGFAWPGAVAARALDVALGPPATASHLRIANLAARVGRDATGRFAGADVRLAAVPLDILDASGSWRFANGRLDISDGAFRVEDRQLDDRFQPLRAQDARLVLAANVITADAVLREPVSGRSVVGASIRHDLGRGVGYADLKVPDLRFDREVQPDTLTRLALGVVANVSGGVRGTGRIDWTPAAITSSGRFSADSLDLAAAFGPVQGVSGEVVFTDLLGLVTAPAQTLRIAAINPGIEVFDGTLQFAMLPGNVLQIDGASWPFLDGRLQLLPTRMVLGVAEVRRYTLVIEALDAAKFVQQIELGNVSATGSFDGRLPLVFDENGGRIEGGVLVSRPPGGNVSYVGPLTYKDMTPIANFAFDALKSVDYRQMRIDMNGPLVGEIVTRVSFDGLSQGATARRNILTRQVAKLPLRFNVNLRAPFFRLVRSFKSLYDPTYIRDPRELGILGADGRPRSPADANRSVDVQPPVSGKTP